MSERRKPRFLSPSNLMLSSKDPEEWYLKYISPHKPPRLLQTEAMCVGSAFDCFIKAKIAEDLQMDSRHSDHSFEKLFDDAVESHNRDFARTAGLKVFNAYKRDCYPSLIAMLERADGAPYMEASMGKTVEGVPFFGKPDLLAIIKQIPVILDWKVNGYMSARTTSPIKGYCGLWDNNKGKFNTPHKDATTLPSVIPNIIVNKNIEHSLPSDWDLQTDTYAWLVLESVPETPFIKMIDQVCGPKDKLRFARHSYESNPTRSREYMDRYQALWSKIQDGSDAVFAEMGIDAKSLDVSAQMLAGKHEAKADAGSPLAALDGRITPTDGDLLNRGRTSKPY